LLFGFILADAMAFLNLAQQFFTLAGNHVELIVGQLAPLRLNLALELFPVTFGDIPVRGFKFEVQL